VAHPGDGTLGLAAAIDRALGDARTVLLEDLTLLLST